MKCAFPKYNPRDTTVHSKRSLHKGNRLPVSNWSVPGRLLAVPTYLTYVLGHAQALSRIPYVAIKAEKGVSQLQNYVTEPQEVRHVLIEFSGYLFKIPVSRFAGPGVYRPNKDFMLISYGHCS
jgi:hypothetical protein